MTLPDRLTADHLQAVLLPDTPVTDPVAHRREVAAQVATLLDRVTARRGLLDAWADRFPPPPPPRPEPTLQELVQAARHELRSERAREDRVELDARAAVIAHVRDGLV
jgi:hypothetical protein